MRGRDETVRANLRRAENQSRGGSTAARPSSVSS